MLRVSDSPVLVDSGTYIYNPDTAARFSLKRGAAHNILMVDGIEQCDITENRVFGLTGEMKASIDMETSEEVSVIRMKHDAYRRRPLLGDIDRAMACRESTIDITERIAGEGRHWIRLYLNFHPDVDFMITANTVNVQGSHVRCRIHFMDEIFLTAEEGRYSVRYHHVQPTKRLVGSFEGQLPTSLSWRIELL